MIQHLSKTVFKGLFFELSRDLWDAPFGAQRSEVPSPGPSPLRAEGAEAPLPAVLLRRAPPGKGHPRRQ